MDCVLLTLNVNDDIYDNICFLTIEKNIFFKLFFSSLFLWIGRTKSNDGQSVYVLWANIKIYSRGYVVCINNCLHIFDH